MTNVIYVLGPNLVSSAMLTLVFLWLWRSHGEDYLGIWALGWALFTLRYAYGVAGDAQNLLPGQYLLPLLAVARGTVMLWGAHAMVGRALPAWWIVLVVLDVALLVFESVTGWDLLLFGTRGVTHYFLFGTGLIGAGVIVLGRLKASGIGAPMAGLCFVGMGLIQYTFPWSSLMRQLYAEQLFMAVQITNLGIAVGILLAFFAQAQAEAKALSNRLAKTLTRVLEDYLPICAHCHSIRDGDGGWSGLERYVEDRTGSHFSHGVCPTCMDTHYGVSA
ncbi:MAG: hypothetical protein RH859_05105 [Longimicrobiales bacterium]